MPTRELSDDDYESFLQEGEFAVVLLDAPWDIGPGATIRPRFERAAEQFGSQVNFAEVNTDKFARVRSIPIANVPAVAYYRSGQLIAALIGAKQDITARIQAVLDGKPIGRNDGWG